MKALTLKQPWASLVALEYKRYEFRTWKTKFRGELLIHAGNGIDQYAMKKFSNLFPNEKYMPKSVIWFKVTITDCIEVTPEFKRKITRFDTNNIYSDVEVGTYAWKIGEVEMLDKPIIDIKGKLGLWEYQEGETSCIQK